MRSDCDRAIEHIEGTGNRSWFALPEPVRAHLERCGPCRELWEFFSKGEDEPWSSETTARIEAELTASLQPVRPLPSRLTLTLGFLSIFAAVSVVFVAFVGLGGAPAMNPVQLLGLLAAIVVAAIAASAVLSGQMRPGERHFVCPKKLLIGLALTLAAIVATAFPWSFNAGWSTVGWHCFRAGFGFSLPAAGLAVLLLTRGIPLDWGTVGGIAGMLAGLVGMAVVHLGCPMQTAPHVAAGHLAVPLAGAGLGYLLGVVLQRRSAKADLRD